MNNAVDELVADIKAWVDNTYPIGDNISTHELKEILHTTRHIRNDVADCNEPTRTTAIMLALICEARLVHLDNVEYFIEAVELYRKQIYKMIAQRLDEKK